MPPIAPDCRIATDGGDAIALPLPDGADALIVPTVTRAEVQDLSRADHALHALLYPDPDAQSQDRPMHPADIVNGTTLIKRIHAEAQQGAIDLHARVDDWLANILAGSWPRAQPLLAPAARLFGWDALEGQIDAPPAVDFINRRLASDRFAQQVQQKGHPLHRAWQQLAKPTRPGQSWALWWQGAKVDELITTIRRDYPELEQRLDWHRIALREERTGLAIASFGGRILFGVVLLQLLGAMARCQDNGSPMPSLPSASDIPVATAPRVPGGLGDVAADMQAAVRAAFGKDIPLDLLNAQAPLVHALFASNWRAGMGMGWTRARYVEAMTGIIRNRYALLARQKGGDSLIAMQRQRLKEERALKGDHWARLRRGRQAWRLCRSRADPGRSAGTGAGHRSPIWSSQCPTIRCFRRRAAASPSPARSCSGVIDQSGLSLDQVSAAFQNKGKDREQCLTHIALLDAALDAKQGHPRRPVAAHLNRRSHNKKEAPCLAAGRFLSSASGQAAIRAARRALFSFLSSMSRFRRDRWSMNTTPSRWSISSAETGGEQPSSCSSWIRPSRSIQLARITAGRSTSANWSGTDRQPSL